MWDTGCDICMYVSGSQRSPLGVIPQPSTLFVETGSLMGIRDS